jgi:hypothetical protein
MDLLLPGRQHLIVPNLPVISPGWTFSSQDEVTVGPSPHRNEALDDLSSQEESTGYRPYPPSNKALDEPSPPSNKALDGPSPPRNEALDEPFLAGKKHWIVPILPVIKPWMDLLLTGKKHWIVTILPVISPRWTFSLQE